MLISLCRWAKDGQVAASPAAASDGVVTPVRRLSDLDVLTTTDNCYSSGRPKEKYMTPTPARTAAATIEQRILEKIASVCTPGPASRLHGARRSAAVSNAGSDDTGHR